MAGVTVGLLLACLLPPRAARALGQAALSSGIHANVVGGSLSVGYPSAGALLVGDDPATASSWCSGVLIGCRTFLTAAHCVCDGDGKDCQGAGTPLARSRIVFFQHAGFFRAATVAVHPDYRFPQADVAVIRLTMPVTGIAPARLASTVPPVGTLATIVGFGRSGGQVWDFGLKRTGNVTTDACPDGLPDTSAVCWTFTGGNADSCDGDSGGPLFTDLGPGTTVAGVTSGGNSDGCLPGDVSFETSVAAYRAWIEAQAGDDLDRLQCSGVPAAGDADTAVDAAAGRLSAEDPAGYRTLTVPPGTNELRVALNAQDDGASNFDLYVNAGSDPTPTDFDCRATGPSQYGYCELRFPTPGTWHLVVRRVSGAGAYQLTTTLVGGAPPECGNDVRESGEDCDGSDDAACPGVCTGCACAYQCSEGGLVSLKTRLGKRLTFRGLLVNRTGEYSDLDPHADGLTVKLDDGEDSPLEITIPAGQEGWNRSAPGGNLYLWRGEVAGAKDVSVRCRRLATGDWQLRVNASRKARPGHTTTR